MSSASLMHLREGVMHVLRRPVQSGLNALTCAVAIAVTVNVISLNYGMDADIRGDLLRFGRRTVDVGRTPHVTPGTAMPSFGDAEVAKIRGAVAGLGATVVPVRQRQATVSGEAVQRRVALAAAPADYPKTMNIPVIAGRWLDAGDAGAASCVLDESVARRLFPGREPKDIVGRSVKVGIEGEPVSKVVGILEDPMTYRGLFDAFDENRSSRTISTILLSFRNVYLPPGAIPAADITFVAVTLGDDAAVDEAAKRLSRIWPQVDADDPAATVAPISILKRRDWIDAMGGVTQTSALLGNLVWILIVLVACVMISTINLITIRERFDEIAVRRCEGARKRHLVLQVAGENVLTSAVGGLLGLPLGLAGAAVLRRIVDFPFRFDVRYAGVAMLVALVLGLVASWIPARRAASLDPARVLTRRLT